MRGGKYQIIEGNTILAGEAAFIEADIFKVKRFEGIVTYYVNDVLIRTVATTTESDLYLDVSLYASGDQLADAVVTDLTDTQYATAQTSASISTMSTNGNITIGDEVIVAAVEMASISSLGITYTDNWFTQTMASTSSMTIGPPVLSNGGGQIAETLALTGVASDYVYSSGIGVMEAFTGEGGYGGVVINVGISANTTMPFMGDGLGTNGQLNTPSTTSAMPYFDSLAADHAYGEGVGETEPFTSLGGEYIPVQNGDAKILTGLGTQGNGVLLESGRHLLTAAHIVEDIVNFANIQVEFNTHISISVALPEVIGITIHPQWDASNIQAGYDLAIIEFREEVDPLVLRLPLYTDSDEITKEFIKTSYSPQLDPNTGVITGVGWDTINNRFDALSSIINNVQGGAIGLSNQLMFDYDNGLTVNDALGSKYGINDVGIANEGGVSGGDSGSAAIIDGKIAGITSWGVTLGSPPDVTTSTDGSYGEVSSETRVSVFADWIFAVSGQNSITAELSLFSTEISAEVSGGTLNNTELGWFSTDIEAYYGAQAEANILLTTTATATTIPVMRAELPFMGISIEANVLSGSIITGVIEYTLTKEVEAFFGAQVEISLFNTVIEASVTTGSVSKASIPFPVISVEAVIGEQSLVVVTLRTPDIEFAYMTTSLDMFDLDVNAESGLDCEVL